MNQGNLESRDTLVGGSGGRTPGLVVSSNLSLLSVCAAALVPFGDYFLDLSKGRQLLAAYEAVVEAGVSIQLCRHLVMHKHTRRLQTTLAGLAFGMGCLSLAHLPQALQCNLLELSDNLLIQSNLCYCLALCGTCYVFITWARAARADILYWSSAAAIALPLYGMQYRYLLSGMASVSSNPTFLAYSNVHACLRGCHKNLLSWAPNCI